jgi:uncharacterized membrane protein
MMDGEGKEENPWLFPNDWPMRKYLTVMGIMIASLGLFEFARLVIGDNLGTNIIGYLFVPFIVFFPGIAILRSLRLHGIGFTRSVLYSLPLGIAFLMASGFLLNLFHYANIMQNPLSFAGISVGYPLLLIALTWVSYRRDSEYVAPAVKHEWDLQLILTVILAALLPFVMIVGSLVAGYSGSRDIIQWSLVVVCLAPLIILSHRTKHYELLILSLSLTLLFSRALMTSYLNGYDVFSEYNGARAAVESGFWNIFDYSLVTGWGANTELSLVTLAPMLSHLTSIEPVQLLKVVYPILFSFVPLAIFKAVQSVFGSRPAFLASTLFIGYQTFFVLMVWLTKQQVAEIFLVSILLLFTDPRIARHKKKLLLVTFVVGILVSHYAVAYITLGLLAGIIFLQSLDHLVIHWKNWRRAENRSSFFGWARSTVGSWWRNQRNSDLFTIDILIVAVLFFITWYSIAASGGQLSVVSDQQSGVAVRTATGAFSLSSLEAMQYLLIDYSSLLHNTEKYLVLIAQIVTVIGVMAVLKDRKIGGKEVPREFLYLGVLASLLVVACYVIPDLSATFLYNRFFHVGFIFMSGFLFIGFFSLLKNVNGIRSYFFKKRNVDNAKVRNAALGIATLFVVIFMLFNTSTIYTFTNEYRNSFALDESSTYAVYSDSDVATALWISNPQHSGSTPVLADLDHLSIYRAQQVNGQFLPYQFTPKNTDSLVYLTTWNVKYDFAKTFNINGSVRVAYTPLSDVLKQLNGNYDTVYSSSDHATVLSVPPQVPTTNSPAAPFYTFENTPFYVFGAVAAALLVLMALSMFATWRTRTDR